MGAPSRLAQDDAAHDNFRALAASASRQYQARPGPGPIQDSDRPASASGSRATPANSASALSRLAARPTTRSGSTASRDLRNATRAAPTGSGAQATHAPPPPPAD